MTVDFKNFDEDLAFHDCVRRAKDADARNFVLDFSHDSARCAFDIDESGLKTLLETEVGNRGEPLEFHCVLTS